MIDVRRLRLPPRPVSRPAGVGPERLRARPLPPRPGGRPPRPLARRAEHRPLQADARRALRPRQGPLRRRPARRGRPRRSSPCSAATRSATTSPRTPRGCSCSTNIREGQPRKIVQYFEVVKEKAPELVLTFDQLLAIGTAYRDISEYERAMIVWRGLIEASYLEDARVGEVLRQRGQTLEGIAYLLDLWRSYPNTASIESDFFGLSQVLAQAAPPGDHRPDAPPRAGRGRRSRGPSCCSQSIRLIQVVPGPVAQEPAGRRGQPGAGRRLPRARGLRGGRQAGGPVRQALPQEHATSTASSTARRWATSTSGAVRPRDRGRRDDRQGRPTRTPAGVDQPSPNKWQALYILGQIYDARRQPARALEYYQQVADRFTDAAGAIAVVHAQGAEAARGHGGPARAAAGGGRASRRAASAAMPGASRRDPATTPGGRRSTTATSPRST